MRFQCVKRTAAGRALRGTMGLSMTVAVGMLAVTTGPILALPGKPADDTVYTLERVYSKGDVDRYKVKSEVHTDGTGLNGATKILIALILKEQTREVKADGNAILNDTFEEASADLGTSKMDVTAFLPAITQTRNKQARVLETKSDGGTPGAGDMAGQIGSQLMFFYPGKPVKVGDSWDIDYDDKKAAVTTKTKAKGTLVAIEALNGAQTAKIKLVTDAAGETEDPASHAKIKVSAHFDGIGNMDLKTGKIVLMTARTIFKGGPLTENQLEWKLKTGDDKDDAPGGDKTSAAKGAAKGN